jgi:hypothetical protein
MGVKKPAIVLLKYAQEDAWFPEPTTEERTGKCVSLVGQFVAVNLGSFAFISATKQEEEF